MRVVPGDDPCGQDLTVVRTAVGTGVGGGPMRSVPGCEREAFCRGWCSLHYHRVRRTGDVGPAQPLIRPPAEAECAVVGCGQAAVPRGFCPKHYQRWRRSGDPGPPGRLPRAQDLTCPVEGCDKAQFAVGLCRSHYHQMRSNRPDSPRCEVAGCDRAAETRGWCVMHYHRWRRTGDPGQALPLR